MSLTNENGMVMPVGPMYGNGGGFGGFGGDGSFWIIVLFLFALMGNGWGNAFGGGGGAMPYMMTNTNNDIQRGFDQQAVIGGINSIAQGQCAGFAAAESGAASRALANLQQQYAMQTAIDGRLDTIAMSLQNCCCENRAATADLKYTLAQEGAVTRANTDAKVQLVLDKLCQLEMDGIRQNYDNRIANMQSQLDALRDMNANARFDASQIAQTANIINALKPATTTA